MWARIIEVMLGVFLAISSFLFHFETPLFLFNISVAVWIWICSFASFYFPLRKVHLLNFVAIFALVFFAFKEPNPPPPPPFQNYVVLALLLTLFAIIPTHASSPPEPWAKFYRKHKY